MVLATTQLEKIDAARQSLEVTEAMAAISDDDVQLSADEEQHILDNTASEEEAQALREAAMLAKKSKEATKRAKQAVNKSVPAERLFQRPSFGHVSAKATYHTRDAYRFLLGRNPRSGVKDNKRIRYTRIVGLFEAANAVKNIEAGYQMGCPYAAWTLVKLEEQMQRIRSLFKRSQDQAEALIAEKTHLLFDPFASRHPTTVTLDFRSSYGFHFSDLLTQYDLLLRSVISYKLHSIITAEDYRMIERKMGTPLRELFLLTDAWEFVGREAAEEKNARLQEIEFRLGVLPDDILSGQRLPTIAKSATYLQGGNDD